MDTWTTSEPPPLQRSLSPVPLTRKATLVLGIGLLGLAPCDLYAQDQARVSGLVEDVNGTPVRGARVGLEGVGIRFSSDLGAFDFGDVSVGAYELTVQALGYLEVIRTLVVSGDQTLSIALEPAPIALDPLVVAPGLVRVRGRVVDVGSNDGLGGADILTDQNAQDRTNSHGRFDLDVWEGVPLRLQVRAFGYLPLDTALASEGERDHLLPVEEDRLVEKMVAVEVNRLEERAGGRLATLFPALNRQDLLRWSGATLEDVILARYPRHELRVRCVVFDEKALHLDMVGPTLQTTFAEEVERIEFLFRGAMLRVYTREFIRTMLGGGLTLRRPTYSDMARPPLCS